MRRVIVWGALLYTLSLLSLSLLWRLGVDVWWVALPSIVLPFLFAPLLLLVPLVVWVRSRPYLFSVGVLTALFVISYGGLFLPRLPVSEAESDPALRIATFNHLKSNTDFPAIKAAILRADADIVALQELSLGVARLAETELLERYPYQVLRPAPADGRQNGVGVLSRFPLENPSYSEGYRGQRFGLEVAGRRFELVNVHFNVPFEEGRTSSLRNYDPTLRDGQLDALLSVAEDVPSLIVVGDFNLGGNEPSYQKLAAILTDSYRRTETGFGFTYPARKAYRGLPLPPLVRLDYVWAKGVEPVSVTKDCRTGSDHCLVVADVKLP